MDYQTLSCSCGASLRAPISAAPGKAKCPKCGADVAVPASAPAVGTGAGAPAPELILLTAEDAAAAPERKPCPYCGESILAAALKCRHCGEFLDQSAVPSARRAKGAGAPAVNEPNPAEFFVAILLSPIGLLIGAIWAARGLPKAKKMLQVSGLSLAIICVAALLVKTYLFTPEEGPSAKIPPGADQGQPYFVVVPGAEGSEGQQPPGSGRAPGLSKVDLEGQPPAIQRSMRANVRIEAEHSLGSGVVVERDGDDVVILTNRHVVDPNFKPSTTDGGPKLDGMAQLRVAYYNEQSNLGKVTWIAPNGIDLALVRANAPKQVEPVPCDPATKVVAGQEVFAVGNPIGLGWTYTKGVVSALRPDRRGAFNVSLIQTDTSITHGNSGGGLYTTTGELVGINTSIADPRFGNGLGFAIRTSVLADLKPEGLMLFRSP
jgi:S1-C subfamily serine protease